MNNYLVGIILAFFGPMLHAWSNIIDNHFSNKIFKRLEPMIFFSQVVGLFFLPIIIFFDPPHFISIKAAGIILIIALIEVFYLFPYYYSLRHTDTSVVASLFSLGKLFIPLSAFLFINEKLSVNQYLGFFVLTLSSVILSVDFKKRKLNRAFVLMFIVSILLSIESVLLKYLYQAGMSWGSSIFWLTTFQFLIGSCFFLNPKNVKELPTAFRNIKSVGKLFLLTEILSWIGVLTANYALYLIPVSVAKGISSTQPVFVLIYALLFAKFSPSMFKEYLGKDGVYKKVILFILTIIGVWLIS